MSKTNREVKDELHKMFPQYKGFIEHTLVATMCNQYHLKQQQLRIPAVVGRSEQLVAFCRWYNQAIPSYETTEEEIVETYLRESTTEK